MINSNNKISSKSSMFIPVSNNGYILSQNKLSEIKLIIQQSCKAYIEQFKKTRQDRLLSGDFRCLFSEKEGRKRAELLLAHCNADNSFFHFLQALEFLRRSSSKKLKHLVFAKLLSGKYGEYYYRTPERQRSSHHLDGDYIPIRTDNLRSDVIEVNNISLGRYLEQNRLISYLLEPEEPVGYMFDKVVKQIDLAATVSKIIEHDYSLHLMNKNTVIEMREITNTVISH